MMVSFLAALAIVAVGVILLGVKILLSKNGRFPNIHVSGNRELRKRGIDCVESQDRQARKKSPFAISEVASKVEDM